MKNGVLPFESRLSTEYPARTSSSTCRQKGQFAQVLGLTWVHSVRRKATTSFWLPFTAALCRLFPPLAYIS
eukprot:3828646-Rhodomonas_salina.1